MCGVAGILNFDGAPPARDRLIAMSHALAHRGPDGGGVQVIGPCGLAHRRLSIIDLSDAGRQPMCTADGRLWLTYNGEVYNYLELRDELEELGHTFRSHTDSEVILEAYRAWGLPAFARFNGMWGLGIWDVEQQALVLSRDRMGVKPLYLHRSGGRLAFASEVKALLAMDPALAELDLAGVAEFIDFPIVGTGGTFFRGVERLEPGTTMVIGAGGRTTTHRYWTFTPDPDPAPIAPERAADELRELLVDAVRLRFRSDVPVGTCLSGGLDSSSIVAIASKKLGKAPETFSAIYEAAGFDEGQFVRIMVDALSLTGHEIRPDASDLPEVMERSTYFQEEPTAGPGIYSQWHVMRTASTRVRVLLDGQGGDELLGGYFPYFDAYVKALLRRARGGDLAAAQELLRADGEIAEVTGKRPLETNLRHFASYRYRLAKGAVRGLSRRALARVGALAEPLAPWVEQLDARLAPRPGAPSTPISRLGAHVRPGLAARKKPPAVTGDSFIDLLWDQTVRTSIPGLLQYEDRNSMAFSIEARVPFLDYRLVEYAFRLPMSEKIHLGSTKRVLRDAMVGILPEPIRTRRDKKGYPTPFTLWLQQQDHHDWARDLLFSSQVAQRGFVDTVQAEALWSQHLAGASDHSWRLWQLITLELFARRFLDGRFQPEAPPARAVLDEDVPIAAAPVVQRGMS